jgi:hypothetical protein
MIGPTSLNLIFTIFLRLLNFLVIKANTANDTSYHRSLDYVHWSNRVVLGFVSLLRIN